MIAAVDVLPTVPADLREVPLPDPARRLLQLRRHRVVPAVQEAVQTDRRQDLDDLLLGPVPPQPGEVIGRHGVRQATTLLVWASAAGLGLWLVNFYVIAPIGGWTWFPEDTIPLRQFIAHTFFYGAVLGLYLNFAARRG
jgi:hypothetical protein